MKQRQHPPCHWPSPVPSCSSVSQQVPASTEYVDRLPQFSYQYCCEWILFGEGLVLHHPSLNLTYILQLLILVILALFSLIDTYYPSLLFADTVCTHSHALLLLVQLNKIVTTAHEQTAITRDACWKHNICQFERGVNNYLWVRSRQTGFWNQIKAKRWRRECDWESD